VIFDMDGEALIGPLVTAQLLSVPSSSRASLITRAGVYLAARLSAAQA
jgi:hypothetical protein